MTVYVGEQRISSRNRFGRGSLISFNEAWRKVEGLLLLTDDKKSAKITLAAYKESEKVFTFEDWAQLSNDLEDAVNARDNGSLSRKNKFYEEGGENNNVSTVIYKSKVPASSSGWNNPKFFENLGDPRTGPVYPESISSRTMLAAAQSDEPDLREVAIKGLRRRAEQEYLMQNMAKGPLLEAAQIAQRKGFGIAVRGTGLLAHMGIESGAPTKSQEFKNKTSKEIDLWLCDELMPKDLGSVVHFDPRVGWTSVQAARLSKMKAKRVGKSGQFKGSPDQQKQAFSKFIESDWKKKWTHINTKRKLQLPRLELPKEDVAKEAFASRLKEYLEEDYEYRFGHYAPYTELVGPCVRLKLRPSENMYGDHDLFVFTYSRLHGYGKIVQEESQVTGTQVALQQANAFQAQHGGIWYWVPTTDFNRGIRAKIMGAHSPPDGEPLVYILPDNTVTAAFYVPGNGCADRLVSVWECPAATKWLKTTHSGELLLKVG